jgi:hypothetical protein
VSFNAPPFGRRYQLSALSGQQEGTVRRRSSPVDAFAGKRFRKLLPGDDPNGETDG